MIVSGVGQGLVWTAMFIAVSTGVAPAEQGVANGLATTILSLGEAIGLALLVVVAHAAGSQAAVAIAAAGMATGIVLAFGTPPHPTARRPQRTDSARRAGRHTPGTGSQAWRMPTAPASRSNNRGQVPSNAAQLKIALPMGVRLV
jgi:predicted MFS family arabinose efflux permease